MAEKITFAPGSPVEVALKYATGKAVRGIYGEQALFTCTDDRVFYLDPEPASDVEHRIGELGIAPGEPFQLTKIKHARGGGCSFRVNRIEHEEALERTLRQSIAQRQHREEMPARTPQASPPAQVVTPARDVNARLAEPASNHNASPSRSYAMCAALCAAVDAIVEAQAYASRKGLGVTFSEESVRAIGLSIYIGEQRGTR